MFKESTVYSSGPYKVTSLSSNLNSSIVTNQQDYGFSTDVDMLFAYVDSQIINLQWDVLDPVTNQSANLNDGIFNYFTVSILDKNNEIVSVLNSSLKDKFYSFDVGVLPSFSQSIYKDVNFLRDCKIQITSFTVDGLSSSGVFVFNFKFSTFENVEASTSDSIFVNYELTNKQYSTQVFLQKSPSYSFEYIEDQSAGFPASSISYSPDYSEKKFYRLVSQDFYNTGTAYNIGLIKLDILNQNSFDIKPQNISGALSINYDPISYTFDRRLFIKWARNSSNVPLNYEIQLLKSGDSSASDVFYYNSPKIDSIDAIVQGTGNNQLSFSQQGINAFYSGTSYESIFSPSGASGIQWKPHTIILDSRGTFPGGVFASSTIDNIYSISFDSGSLNSKDLYLVYYYDENTNSFVYYPSEGSYSSGLYSGQLVTSTSGINYLNNYTGALVAERVDLNYPSGSIVVSPYEPSFYIPFFISEDYQVRVRGVLSNNDYTDFSDLISFSKDTIDEQTLIVHDPSSGIGNGTSLIECFTQASHGFTTGNLLRFDGTTWYKAIADSAENAEVMGMVQTVDGNEFCIVYNGKIDNLSGLTAGVTYFLSPYISGEYTPNETDIVGEVSKPVLIALSSTEGNYLNYRGAVISPSAPDAELVITVSEIS